MSEILLTVIKLNINASDTNTYTFYDNNDVSCNRTENQLNRMKYNDLQ
jgi:hypothetical protein